MNVEAYLRRIGYNRPRGPSATTLRNLHRQHLFTVPFENLDIALGTPIILDPDALFDKIVIRKRGGFCYELNSVFHDLLTALGFRAEMLSARVRSDKGEFSQEFDHMLLKVNLEEAWIADVGFGESFVDPLPLRVMNAPPNIAPEYGLVLSNEEWDLVRRQKDGSYVPVYRFTEVARQLGDFNAMCRYHQTSPESHFMRNRICSRATPDGRITVAGMRLIVTRSGERQESELSSKEELQDCLLQHFGIALSPKSNWSRLTV